MARMRFLLFAITLAAAFLNEAAAFEGGAAIADSATIKSFGLIGTWSTDCNRNPSSLILTYSEGDFFFGPKIKKVLNLRGMPSISYSEITAAEILSFNKIRYTQTPIKDPVTAHLDNRLPSTVVMEKIDNKIRERDRVLSDGKVVTQDGIAIFLHFRDPQFWLERCAN